MYVSRVRDSWLRSVNASWEQMWIGTYRGSYKIQNIETEQEVEYIVEQSSSQSFQILRQSASRREFVRNR